MTLTHRATGKHQNVWTQFARVCVKGVGFGGARVFTQGVDGATVAKCVTVCVCVSVFTQA